ncbi:MAG TPA: hypothetical protein VF017_22810 [Thermoanaerobaculia bacterium]|nr:hypothetical protein [Thermoanaerobaculia bacterium]
MACLLGSAQVATALPCLASLLSYSAEPLSLRIHDDGSLTTADRERLTAQLGPFELVTRRQADAAMAEKLAAHPACRSYRESHPLGLKLLDVPLLAREEALAFCDSDVLFLRPFLRLFELPPAAGALLMRDRQNAYSVRSWHLATSRCLALPRRANSGILAFRRAAFDLDLAEWFLRDPRFAFAPVWREQTAWALLARRAGCALLDEAQVRIPAPGEPIGPETVALHFVSPVRHLLADVAARAPDRRGEPPVPLRSALALPCRPWHLLGDELRRRLGRRGR